MECKTFLSKIDQIERKRKDLSNKFSKAYMNPKVPQKALEKMIDDECDTYDEEMRLIKSIEEKNLRKYYENVLKESDQREYIGYLR